MNFQHAVAKILPSQKHITNPQEASNLVEDVLLTMQQLSAVLTEEAHLMQAGRVKEALTHEQTKTELSSTYVLGLECIKANSLALRRVSPLALDKLKKAHLSFAETLSHNQTVLATVRAISENLMRSLALETQIEAKNKSYAPAMQSRPAPRQAESALWVSKQV
jgi:hypothetical protein